MADLRSLGEFGFIERALGWTGAANDDAAVLGSLVSTVDVLLEGVHFRLDWSSPSDVGFKAAAVNISDVAAMGAEPTALLVGLGAPPSTSEDTLRELYDGIRESGVPVVGGDTVRSEKLLLSVTALGELDGPPLTRSGARPGDILAVTGPLGRAAAGVNILLSGDRRALVPGDVEACLRAHRRPVARVAEGRALRLAGAHAGLDLSDGLASDAHRLADASGVGVEIDVVPIAEEVVRIAKRREWDAERLALAGGEDYELLVAVPMGFTSNVELIPVGRVVEEGRWLVRDGVRRPLPPGGWDHFRT